MATMTLGGGPSLEQRRGFAALQEGTHVPGYRGYCPQIKYRVGHTYGQETHELAKDQAHVHPVDPALPQPPPILQNDLPSSTGDNKYTKNMIPGYTGYVPGMSFKFGNTYKEDADVCIDRHLTAFKGYSNKQNDLRRHTRSLPKLDPINFDPSVRDHLNTFRETNPQQPLFMEDRRGETEPPIPGYQGYVPRIYTTEQGLGCRYHEMTHNGLELFKAESDFNKEIDRKPITIDRSPEEIGLKTKRTFQRVYPNSGMVPKYTGYVPQRRYHFGSTYGDTTRSLDVCNHKMASFGNYMKGKSLAQSMC